MQRRSSFELTGHYSKCDETHALTVVNPSAVEGHARCPSWSRKRHLHRNAACIRLICRCSLSSSSEDKSSENLQTGVFSRKNVVAAHTTNYVLLDWKTHLLIVAVGEGQGTHTDPSASFLNARHNKSASSRPSPYHFLFLQRPSPYINSSNRAFSSRGLASYTSRNCIHHRGVGAHGKFWCSAAWTIYILFCQPCGGDHPRGLTWS